MSFFYFSADFKFDLCYDFSIWKAEPGKCIPKTLVNSEEHKWYTFPPLCNRTAFNCLDAISGFRSYCPNFTHFQLNCNHDESRFYCEDSKTCIPRGKTVITLIEYISFRIK